MDGAATFVPWARGIGRGGKRALGTTAAFAMQHRTMTTLGAAAVGTGLVGTTSEAEGGYARAIGQMARTARALPRGAWGLGSDHRGYLLEARHLQSLGAGKLPKGFHVFDHFSATSRTATSIKSLDLTGASRQTADQIVSWGRGHLSKIRSFTAHSRKGISLTSRAIKGRNLDIIITPGASAEQLRGLAELVKLGHRYRIGVNIVVKR